MPYDVPAPQVNGKLGWPRGNMRDRYGNGPRIKMLADVIQKVEYPLDLDHIYVR